MKATAMSKLRGAMAVAALTIVTLAVPSLACASVGDVDNPEIVAAPPWSQSETGTTIAVTEDGETWYEYNYLVPLIKGETYVFNCRMHFSIPDPLTPAPANEGGMLILSPTLSPPGVVFSSSGYAARPTMKFMAPVTRYYLLSLHSSEAVSFSVEATRSTRAWFTMLDLAVPKSTKRNRSFKTSVNVYGRYNSLGSPIRFQIQRKVGRRWATYATARSAVSNLAENRTQFASAVKLKRRGTYRIRACFSDAANPVRYTAFRTIKIR